MRLSNREEQIEALWLVFLSSSRALHARARAGVASGGLTFPRVTLLRLLVHRGKATSKDLAHWMGVTTADLPGLLDKLETEGLVTRRRDVTDRRVVYVEATRKGRRKLESLWLAAMRGISIEFEDWSDRDVQTLRDLLARIGPGECGPGCGPSLRAPGVRRRKNP